MSAPDHLETLKEFALWRRGKVDSAKYDGLQKHLGVAIDEVIVELTQLRLAIAETLEENGYLADGDNCTLAKLKRAINLE